ncbi:response regulator transcription factor [Cellulomonas sp. A375-1]|uniref:response regulator transcription factor n=1 Tax=Cellulomonas sp. A375-1 TaxID=1672219 RepID=UPI0009E19386|nr:helix-turn-helix transcriptional regulator [Cellulomonas sp. A375-1]
MSTLNSICSRGSVHPSVCDIVPPSSSGSLVEPSCAPPALTSRSTTPGSDSCPLTPQEQVVRTLGAGRTTREAAAAPCLSPTTIEDHLRNVYAKHGVRSRTDVAAVALAERG